LEGGGFCQACKGQESYMQVCIGVVSMYMQYKCVYCCDTYTHLQGSGISLALSPPIEMIDGIEMVWVWYIWYRVYRVYRVYRLV
jgi:hypothetical protein